MDKIIALKELLEKIEDLAISVEDRIEEGDDLAIARDLIEELREEIEFRME